MVTPNQEIRRAARALLTLCRARKLKLSAAESCTGGLLTATLTEIPGSSEVIDRGFVTYSNQAKQQMLDVPARTLEKYGAVSRETALAMAKGALAHSPADITAAITGIAGPGGGSKQKPVGLVHIAAATRGGARVHHECRFGNVGRAKVREKSVLETLTMMCELIEFEMPKKRRRKPSK
jgi:nicotinamide-nucleotide amidase